MPPRIDRNLRRYTSSWRILIPIVFLSFFSFIIAGYPNDNKETPQDERNRSAKQKLDTIMEQEVSQRKANGYAVGVEVDLVMMYTSVFDKDGNFVSGLKEDNFKLYEDNVEQQITSFDQEDVPVTMGIILDLSGSMRSKLIQVQNAASSFIRASNPQDQVFLIGFTEEVELLQDFTSDIDEINDALENTYAMGGTALYDAIYLGVQKAHEGSRAKKAVVVISDGEDLDSYYKLDELIAKVQESDVQAFCIGFIDESDEKSLFPFLKSKKEKVKDVLKQISEETGGKAFFPDTLTDIHSIVSEIAKELRNQYSIGYTSSNTAHDGTFRRVKIKLVGDKVDNNHLRYRRGYFAPKTEITRN